MYGRRILALLAALLVGILGSPQTSAAASAKKSASAKKTKGKAAAPKASGSTQGAAAPAAPIAPQPLPAPQAAPVPAATPPAIPAPADPNPPPPGFRKIEALGDVAPKPADAAPAVPVVPLVPQVQAEAVAAEPIGLDVALKIAMLVPSGNTADAVAAADASASASKSVFASGALALRYRPPILDRALAVALESGYYRLSGAGKRTFVNDPDYGPELSYDWKMDAIPVLLGLAYQLPLPFIPVRVTPEAGLAAIHVSAESTYTSGSGTVTDAPQAAWALGFYLGVEGALQLGPGSVLLELRYMNARTDLGFQEIYAGPFNEEPGDVQGTNLLLGYRYAF